MGGRANRYGPRFSGAGGRNQPTISQLSGLLGPERSKGAYYAEKMKYLRERASKGDPRAMAYVRAVQTRNQVHTRAGVKCGDDKLIPPCLEKDNTDLFRRCDEFIAELARRTESA